MKVLVKSEQFSIPLSALHALEMAVYPLYLMRGLLPGLRDMCGMLHTPSQPDVHEMSSDKMPSTSLMIAQDNKRSYKECSITTPSVGSKN